MQDLRDQYDVIIAGGGVNGVGIARDLALRGISCLLVEKNDYSAGTSGGSSGMIHGGPRYMLNDVDVTYLSCLDSGYIQKAAPHLLFRIPFLYPVYQNPHRVRLATQTFFEATEAFFSAYDRFVPLKNGLPHLRLSAEEALRLEPGLSSQNLMGAITFDEWGIDVPRLCIANVVDAVENGATALNHVKIVETLFEDGHFVGVVLEDQLHFARKRVLGKILVNATGPWSPEFASRMNLDVKLRPGKGIHLVYDRRLFNMALVTQAIDGREMFVMPYENNTIIATTDDDYFGDLDVQRSQEDEIKYLEEGIAQVFPQIRDSRLIYSYSGVRPTLYARDLSESSLSREHEILDHETRDGRKGVVSLVGGKLASYRVMAEEVCDWVARKLSNVRPCQTRDRPLPGGDSLPDVAALAAQFQTDVHAVGRLVYRHGSRAQTILQEAQKLGCADVHVCQCEAVLASEVLFALQNEHARTLSDLRRRTRLGQGPCQGTQCLLSGLSLLQKHFPQTDIQKAFADFQEEWWWNRAAGLAGAQLQQEELLQALYYGNGSLHY